MINCKKVDVQGICNTLENAAQLLRNLENANEHFRVEIDIIRAENARLRAWVNDLQSGMYVNCVYCGHRYGPEDQVPVSMADALKEHIEHCPQHPMSALKVENERLKAALAERNMHHV